MFPYQQSRFGSIGIWWICWGPWLCGCWSHQAKDLAQCLQGLSMAASHFVIYCFLLKESADSFDWSEFDLGSAKSKGHVAFTSRKFSLTSLFHSVSGFHPTEKYKCRNDLGLLLAGVYVTAHGGWRFDEKLIMSTRLPLCGNILVWSPQWLWFHVISDPCSRPTDCPLTHLLVAPGPQAGWGLQLGIMRW